MWIYFLYFVELLFLFMGCATLIGYVLYKCEIANVKTWEEGIKKTLTFGLIFIYEQATGKVIPEKIIDSVLILTDDEILELVDTFDGHPYQVPTLTQYSHNNNGIAYYNIVSVGLAPSYEQMDDDQIDKMCWNKIHNFYLKKRKRDVHIYILIANSKRLYFAVPLSEEAHKHLEKQLADTTAKPETEADEPLEETIDIFEDSEKEKHDSRIPKD